jgi:hypothetical protein
VCFDTDFTPESYTRSPPSYKGLYVFVRRGSFTQKRKTTMPRVSEFVLDTSIIAKRIYRDAPHTITSTGLLIEPEVREEIREFLSRFLEFSGCNEHVFLRLDAFFDDTALTIIEVNVELHDGWGVALNLLRAAGRAPNFCPGAKLPQEIVAHNNEYLPEFELAREEFAQFGNELSVVSWRKRPKILAKHWLDDKLFLAQFSRVWRGRRVITPHSYWNENTSWDDRPPNGVFKCRDKHGAAATTIRHSVLDLSGVKKGKALRVFWESADAIIQERERPAQLEDWSPMQAILLCSRSEPLCGYLQVAPPSSFIINDKGTLKGPLVFD